MFPIDRYEISSVDARECIQHVARKAEAMDLAQRRANERGERIVVRDTFKSARFTWEFFPRSEGAQGFIKRDVQ